MEKRDLKQELKLFYTASAKEVTTVDVPAMNFLMIEGEGDPNTSQSFRDAVEALFSVSYTTKFLIKKGAMAIDYGVMPLQGLWWMDDMTQFSVDNKDMWKWNVMIMQPEFVTTAILEEAIAQVKKKKKLPALPLLKLQEFHEGKAVQILHIGPYSEEGPAIQKLHEAIAKQGKSLAGKHHEIYLNDPTRTAPEKLKTVIRQPFA